MCLQCTEEQLLKEANLKLEDQEGSAQTDSEVSSVLAAYKSEGDPEVYDGAYIDLKRFVEGALDIYKVKKYCTLLLYRLVQSSVCPEIKRVQRKWFRFVFRVLGL